MRLTAALRNKLTAGKLPGGRFPPQAPMPHPASVGPVIPKSAPAGNAATILGALMGAGRQAKPKGKAKVTVPPPNVDEPPPAIAPPHLKQHPNLTAPLYKKVM